MKEDEKRKLNREVKTVERGGNEGRKQGRSKGTKRK